MAPTILSCGSNAASQLAIHHPNDVSKLTPTVFHPSIAPSIPSSARVKDLVSSSAHSMILVSIPPDLPGGKSKTIVLGAGTNTYGQLGPRCALWDDVKPESRWKILNVASSAGLQGEWEPVKIAATWTTSFVVYQRVIGENRPDQANSRDQPLSAAGIGAGSSSLTPQDDPSENGTGDIEQVVISKGSNDFGELGSASSTPLTLGGSAPAQIPISSASRNPTIVDFGLRAGERVEMIKGGQRHVVAVIDGPSGQRVMGWGASRKGELDASTLSSYTASSTSGAGSSSSAGASSSSSTPKGKGKGKATTRPPFSPPTNIDLPTHPNERIIDISLGASHTLALLSNGTVLAWGSDLKGQITGVHELRGVKGIAASWGGSYFLTHGGEVFSQGSNSHSQLLRGAAGEQDDTSGRGKIAIPDGWEVKRIVAGTEHLLVHAKKRKSESDDHEAETGDAGSESEEGLFSGGWNEHGNLGLGDQDDRNIIEKVELRQHGKGRIRGLWGGCASTWVWTDQD